MSEPNSQDVMGYQLATQRLTLLYASRARHVGPMVDESTRDARAACTGGDWSVATLMANSTTGLVGEVMTGRQVASASRVFKASVA